MPAVELRLENRRVDLIEDLLASFSVKAADDSDALAAYEVALLQGKPQPGVRGVEARGNSNITTTDTKSQMVHYVTMSLNLLGIN